MTPEVWALLIILVILLILGVVVARVTRKRHARPDYFGLYVLGLVWFAAGIPFQNYPLSGLGIVFAILGLTHREEWRSSSIAQKKIDIKKKLAIALVFLIGAAALVTLILLLVLKKGTV